MQSFKPRKQILLPATSTVYFKFRFKLFINYKTIPISPLIFSRVKHNHLFTFQNALNHWNMSLSDLKLCCQLTQHKSKNWALLWLSHYLLTNLHWQIYFSISKTFNPSIVQSVDGSFVSQKFKSDATMLRSSIIFNKVVLWRCYILMLKGVRDYQVYVSCIM